MSASDNGSYASRFFVKFVEIIAAGLATALSGYLIAHLSGALSSPAPAPVTAVSAGPNSGMNPGQPAELMSPPIAADSNEGRATSQPELNAAHAALPAPPVQPEHGTVSAAKPEPTPKQLGKAANSAESAREQRSLIARVRAALANIDANRADPPALPPHQGNVVRQPEVIARPGPDLPNPAAASAPPAVPELRPVPLQEVPAEPNRPAAAELTPPPAAATPSSPAPPAAKDTGMLSTLGQMLRQDPLAGTDEAPRPPMPVGQ
jgi:hypothetical protein